MSVATRLSVSGMSCAGCVASVENAIKNVDGVLLANVNFAEHTATVEGDVTADVLVKAIQDAGYDAAQLIGAEDESEKEAAAGLEASLLAGLCRHVQSPAGSFGIFKSPIGHDRGSGPRSGCFSIFSCAGGEPQANLRSDRGGRLFNHS